MIIFLYGPDDYRRRERERFYIDQFKKKHTALAVERFELDEPETLPKFEEFIWSISLFTPYKMAVPRGLLGLEDKKIIGELKSIALLGAETTVLVSEEKLPPAPLSFLRKDAKVIEEFPRLEGKSWHSFVLRETERRRMKFAPRALSLLVQIYEGDSWRLVSELEKLSILSAPAIEESHFDVIDPGSSSNFFFMLNRLKNTSVTTRLSALERLIFRDSPQRIFYTLAYQWPEKIERFADLDFSIKSGRLDYEEALLEAVL